MGLAMNQPPAVGPGPKQARICVSRRSQLQISFRNGELTDVTMGFTGLPSLLAATGLAGLVVLQAAIGLGAGA